MPNNLVRTTCAKCSCLFAMPQSLYDSAIHSERIVFFCPYGHQLHFTPVQALPQIEKKEKKEPSEESEERMDNVIDISSYRKKENE